MQYSPVKIRRSGNILLTLVILCCCVYTAAGQQLSPRFSLALSGGYSKVNTDDDIFPFTATGSGSFIELSGVLSLGKNWGGVINAEQNFISVDTKQVAAHYLDDDANATSVTIHTGSFRISNFTAGLYYDWKPAEKYAIRFSPSIGYSYLQTPRIEAAVKTAPHTAYLYEKGADGALTYAFSIRPSVRIRDRCAIHIAAAYSYAGYNVSSTSENTVVQNAFNYGKLNVGVGFEYALCRSKK